MIPVDPFDRRARPDPYPVYQYMRTVERIHKSPLGFWILTRYADCRQVLEDRRWSHDADRILEPARGPDEPTDPTVRLLRSSILFSDPPEHAKHLRPLEGVVRKAAKSTEQRATAVAHDLVSLMREKGGRVDLIQDFSSPLAVVVICDLLGIPAADRLAVQRWGRELASGLDPMIRAAGVIRAGAASAALVEYLLDRIDSATLGSGALHDLATMPRKVRTWGLIADLAVLIATGLEATSAFIGNAALALVRHPDVRHELAGRPDRRPSAVEELLRFDSPVHLTARAATVDIDLDGHTVAAGEQVIVMLGAANRDPSRFQDPDRLDISRQDNQHLAFGHGAHSCFAAPLARLIGGPAVMTLAGLEMDLAGDPAWLDTVTMRGLRQLPVTLRT